MASLEPTQLLWKQGGQTFHMTFDVYTDIKYTFSADVTDHPTETGTVSDHINDRPNEVSFNAIVSETPCVMPPDFNQGGTGYNRRVEILGERKTISQFINQLPPGVSVIPGVPPGAPIAGSLVTTLAVGPREKTEIFFADVSQVKRPLLIATALRSLKEAHTAFTFKSKTFTLDSMVIQSITVSPPKFGGRLEFSITLRSVDQATVRTVEAPAIKAKSQGNKSPKTVEEEPQQAQSAASKISDFISGFHF